MLALAILTTHVAWAATPGPQRPDDLDAIATPCAEYARPAPPVHIEGRVVARDGAPRPGVRVRATLVDTDRQYTTATDGEGRFTIAGFDADVDVRLEFEAPSGRMGADCPIYRITRHAPEKKFRIVLDRLEPNQEPTGDCPVWVATAPVKFLSREEQRALFGDREEPPRPVRLELRARDIAAVTWSRDGANVLLNEAASMELRAFSSANAGRLAVVTIDGMVAWSAWISGAFRDDPVVPDPPAGMWISERELRGPLCGALEEVAARARREP